jgi:Protein of unknown function (DUF3096)
VANKISIAPAFDSPFTEDTMTFHVALQPLVALIAGILILVMPRLLNYVVALYLIITGILGLTRL